jgi:hypothetical protein
MLAFTVGTQAQTGNYFLSHYTPNDERIDYLCYGMAQDEFGLLYFTNKNGVLEFDGKHWYIINTPGAVYSVVTQKNEVFASGIFGFGKLHYTEEGQRVFQWLSEGIAGAKDIFSSLVVGERVFFLAEQKLFIYPMAGGPAITVASTPAQGIFSHVFRLDDDVFVQSETALWKVENNALVKTSLAWDATDPIAFSSWNDHSKQKLIGTQNGKLYVARGQQLTPLAVANANRMISSVMVNATWLSDQAVAIGTLRGGVFFVNIQTGELEENTSYLTGLPDNEVYALFSDRNQGVWVAHDYGFTRIAPHLPFRSYNHYPGLQGNLLSALSWGGTVYVGTTLGLWRLVREEVKEQVGSDIKKNNAASLKHKNAFLRLFKRKRETPPPEAPAPTPVLSVTETRYVYKPVAGIDGKVAHLLNANGKLLAAGVAGVFEIDNLTAKPVMRGPVRTAFHSPSLNQLVLATYADDLRTFEQTPLGWQPTSVLDTLQDHISYLFEDKLENLWLCGRNTVYKVEILEGEIADIITLPIENPSIDETVGLAYGSEVYVAASGEFKRYDSQKNLFVKYDSLPGPRKYFASAGNFWFNDGHRWRTIDRKIQNLKLDWLGLFPNLRFLAPADKGLWVITANNELYQFTSGLEDVSMQQERYPLFLREVRAQKIMRAPSRKVKINQEEGSVTFEFIQPDYVGLKAMEYRYQVKGLSNLWTEWSTENSEPNFPYLPPGTYQLNVQSRDLLGRESNVQTVSFEVLPPFWKRWWFYAMEFFVFATLVILSMRLGTLNARYRLLSRFLSMITIVLLIQFIQTVVYSLIEIKSTPVVEFVIQVVIALMVFPVEQLLRKLMYRSAEARLRTESLANEQAIQEKTNA